MQPIKVCSTLFLTTTLCLRLLLTPVNRQSELTEHEDAGAEGRSGYERRCLYVCVHTHTDTDTRTSPAGTHITALLSECQTL